MNQEMEYVYAVYQEGSISKAAEKLFMTQPALSMAIRRVETQLGAILFDRSQHPLKLTKVGEIYIQKFHEIKILEKELTDQINDLHHLQQGELAIGGTHFMLSYVLAPVLSAFSREYPNVEIRLLECSAAQLDGLLLQGKIDMCLKCDHRNPSLKQIDFAFRDHLLVAVPEHFVKDYGLPEIGLTWEMVKNDEYLNPQHPCLSFAQLGSLPYLVLTAGNNLHERFQELFAKSGQTPNVQMQIEQIVTAYHLANSGMGATLTSSIIIKRNISSNLRYYKVDSPLMTRDFYVIGRQKRYLSDANAKFIEMFKTNYE